MTNAGHEDRMLLDDLWPVDRESEIPDAAPSASEPRPRSVSHGRIIDHLLARLADSGAADAAGETVSWPLQSYLDV